MARGSPHRARAEESQIDNIKLQVALILTKGGKFRILMNVVEKFIKLPCSRGVSGALYLQTALAGVISCLGLNL